jgi:probable F420-dependent oxidoreductase
MSEPEVIEAARSALGPVGVLLPVTMGVPPTFDQQREATARLERAGYRAAWTNELSGKDALVQLAVLLAATRSMALGTGIANIWLREPSTLHAAASELAQAYPGRFVLGVGVGYPPQAEEAGRSFGRPVATARDYLARMDGPTWVPVPEGRYPRLLAANGPKMLALAAEVADGALPAGQPPTFTALARAILGPDRLLAVGVTVATADGRPLSSDQVAEAVGRHLDAGADHVELMLASGGDYDEGIGQLERLASAALGAAS